MKKICGHTWWDGDNGGLPAHQRHLCDQENLPRHTHVCATCGVLKTQKQ